MLLSNSYLGIIPARGGSKGIYKKNLLLINNKPLIQYTIEASKKSLLNDFVVTTDDYEIADFVYSLGVKVIMRPPELSSDDTPTLPVINHVLENINDRFDASVLLQPTSPLRNSKHINEAILLFDHNKEAKSLVSVVKTPHNHIPESIMLLDSNGYLCSYKENSSVFLRRQDKPTYFSRNGAAIYISLLDVLCTEIWGDRTIPYFMEYLDSFDIDTLDDAKLVELLIQSKYH